MTPAWAGLLLAGLLLGPGPGHAAPGPITAGPVAAPTTNAMARDAITADGMRAGPFDADAIDADAIDANAIDGRALGTTDAALTATPRRAAEPPTCRARGAAEPADAAQAATPDDPDDPDAASAPAEQTPAEAPAAGEPPVILDCEAAVRRALRRHPGPAAAEALARAVQAEAGQDDRLPEIRLRGGVRTLTDGGRVGFRVPLPGLGVTAARAEVDRTRQALADSDTLTLRLDLAAAVRRLHLAVRRARAETRAARALLTIEADAAHHTDLRHQAGEVPRLAVTTAALDEIEARDAWIRAQQDEARLAAALHALIGGEASAGSCAGDVSVGLTAADHRAAAEAEHMRAEATLDNRQRWLSPEHVELSWDADPEASDRVMVSVALRLPGLALGRDPEGARWRAARAHLEAAQFASARRIAQAEHALADARRRAAQIDDDRLRGEAAEQLAAVHPSRQGMPAVVRLRRALLAANTRRAAAAFAVEEAAIELVRVQDGAEPGRE